MPYKDPDVGRQKAKERKRRWYQRKKARLGITDRGKHGNHARGPDNARWNKDKLITSHGYVLVRVPPDHPHGFGGRASFAYCYEHIAVMVQHLGHPLAKDQHVHHKNGDRTDNRLENLAVATARLHISGHQKGAYKPRDKKGRFLRASKPEEFALYPKDLRHTELPWQGKEAQ